MVLLDFDQGRLCIPVSLRFFLGVQQEPSFTFRAGLDYLTAIIEVVFCSCRLLLLSLMFFFLFSFRFLAFFVYISLMPPLLAGTKVI